MPAVGVEGVAVGIAGTAWWLPEGVMTGEELAQRAGVPVASIVDHIGLRSKRVAGPDDHPSTMAERAAAQILRDTGTDPEDIDVVIFAFEGPLDYNGWSPAASIQNRLGMRHGFAFDLHNACCGANVALTVVAGLMDRDPDVTTGLVLTGTRFADRVDYADGASHILWTLADGATATLVRRDEASNTILGYAEITEPELADLVHIPVGGTRQPFAAPGEEGALSRYRVTDGPRFDHLMSEIYVPRYVQAVDRALEHAGLARADIALLLTNQLRLEVMDRIHDELGVARERTMRSMDFAGHIGPGDTLMNLARAQEAGMIEPGDVVVLATSGLGFSWAATVLRYA
jgi:3-oxoacyl-[acyl-carrier-protein] synthase-3